MVDAVNSLNRMRGEVVDDPEIAVAALVVIALIGVILIVALKDTASDAPKQKAKTTRKSTTTLSPRSRAGQRSRPSRVRSFAGSTPAAAARVGKTSITDMIWSMRVPWPLPSRPSQTSRPNSTAPVPLAMSTQRPDSASSASTSGQRSSASGARGDGAGPAAGALAGRWYARRMHQDRLLCFDMGGTTVSLLSKQTWLSPSSSSGTNSAPMRLNSTSEKPNRPNMVTATNQRKRRAKLRMGV